LGDYRASQELSPNAYFAQIYPNLVPDYGFPFVTTVRKTTDSSDMLKPRTEQLKGINTLFFAALLGGDRRLGHDVIYFIPEGRFYFVDPLIACYVPTTEVKMRFYLTHVLQERVWGYDADDAQLILEQFCTPKVLDTIIDQAKALLGAERGFFKGPRAYPRLTVENQESADIAATVRSFIKNQIDTDETSILTITECMNGLKTYSQETGVSLPSIKEVKAIVQTNIRNIHGRGLRNDLVLPDKTCVVGWKGIRLDHLALTPVQQQEDQSERSDSGVSELSDTPSGQEVALLS